MKEVSRIFDVLVNSAHGNYYGLRSMTEILIQMYSEVPVEKRKSLLMRFILAISLICLSFLSIGSENELNSAEAPKSILFWNTEEKLLGFKNIQHILPTRLIKKSPEPYSVT